MISGPVLPHWEEAEPGVAERLKPRTFLNHITEIYKSEENAHFRALFQGDLASARSVFDDMPHLSPKKNRGMIQHKTHKNHTDVIEKLCFLLPPPV